MFKSRQTIYYFTLFAVYPIILVTKHFDLHPIKIPVVAQDKIILSEETSNLLLSKVILQEKVAQFNFVRYGKLGFLFSIN